ncbi:MAG: transposase family protein [Gemmatimonadaceae bacterium]|nr:transposase family protein [Gloeobacterales cyanobacterium ES-bin-141]
MQVVRLYSNKTAASTRAFLEQMVSAFPFLVQRVQTDRGEEFFATAVQYWLMDHRIKFRPIRPYSPHLNGKMERVQRTDREEFYNRAREHGSLLYKTPAQRWEELREATPTAEQVRTLYDPMKERLRVQDYRLDKQNLAEQRSR